MVTLRPRQEQMLTSILSKIEEGEKKLLAVAPTGAGKTVIFSFLLKKMLENKNMRILVLCHRQEVSNQNLRTFKTIGNDVPVGHYFANEKAFSRDNSVIFSMQQTAANALRRDLNTFGKIDMVLIDETHHIGARSYMDILTWLNPEYTVGFTATPLRSDHKKISAHLPCEADRITFGELISQQLLVKPVFQVGEKKHIDTVLDSLNEAEEYAVYSPDQFKEDQTDYESNIIAHLAKALETFWLYWEPQFKVRKTVVFCGKVMIAKMMARMVRERGVRAAYIEASMPERGEILKQYADGELDILFNVNILTEGWDDPETSCIVFLRGKGVKSAIVQMIGRGLRTYPGKSDCLILDLGGIVKHLGRVLDVFEVAGQTSLEKEKKKKKEKKKPERTAQYLQKELSYASELFLRDPWVPGLDYYFPSPLSESSIKENFEEEPHRTFHYLKKHLWMATPPHLRNLTVAIKGDESAQLVGFFGFKAGVYLIREGNSGLCKMFECYQEGYNFLLTPPGEELSYEVAVKRLFEYYTSLGFRGFRDSDAWLFEVGSKKQADYVDALLRELKKVEERNDSIDSAAKLIDLISKKPWDPQPSKGIFSFKVAMLKIAIRSASVSRKLSLDHLLFALPLRLLPPTQTLDL